MKTRKILKITLPWKAEKKLNVTNRSGAKPFYILLLVFLCCRGLAQMNNWAMPPYSFNATSNPMNTTNPLYPGAPTNGSYFVANGAYDNSGNLLFYVKNDTVYNKNGITAGPLGIINGSSGYFGGTYRQMCGEIAIVPIPGTCASFYVIYARTLNLDFGSNVGYIMVDASNPVTPIITYDSSPGGPPNAFLINPGDIGGNNTSIAVSKKIGTGLSATYYLYYTTYNGPPVPPNAFIPSVIGYAVISSSGINSGGYLGGPSSTDDLSWSPELELSEDGNWLAAAGRSSGGWLRMNVFNLSNDTTAASINVAGFYKRVGGLEFVGSGTPDLYVGGTDNGSGSGLPIFDKIDSTGAVTPLQSNLGGHRMQYTFLEYGKNGYLYGIEAHSPPTLIEYKLTSSGGYVNNTFALNVTPQAGASAAYPYQDYVNNSNDPFTYTLPDQIDGADYSHFNTPVYITGMYINGSLAHNCDGTAYDIYSCAGVHITATTNDELKACSQQLEITPYDAIGCNAISNTGVGYLNYLGEVVGNLAEKDIAGIEDGFGNTLAAGSGVYVSGVYKVKLTITDCCGNTSSMYEIIRMRYAPSIDLELYDHNSGFVPASHSTPIPAGALSLGFRVNNSSGDADNMNVQVDQLTGTWGGVMAISNIISQNAAVSNLSSLTNEQLNGYSPLNYFSSNGSSIVGNYYKLTVTLSNDCGTSSDYSYLQIDNANARPALATGVKQLTAEQNAAQVYPNPASDNVQIAIKSQQSDVYQIMLYDISGRVVKTIADKMNLNAGDHTLDVNTTDLQTGVYTWRINSLGINQNGLISIVK